MKKTVILTLLVTVMFSSFAQYKKASFFNKDGRVYELGAGNSLFSDRDGKPAMSLFYSNQLENDKKLSGLVELEFMLKSKFTYTGTYYDNNQNKDVTGIITADRGSAIIGKYGAQYRFVNAEKEDQKLIPYLRLALITGLDFGASNPRTANNGSVSPDPYPNDTESFAGLEGGGGVSYYFTKNFGIRIGGVYTVPFIIEKSITGNTTYHTFKNHPGITISLKYKIFSE